MSGVAPVMAFLAGVVIGGAIDRFVLPLPRPAVRGGAESRRSSPAAPDGQREGDRDAGAQLRQSGGLMGPSATAYIDRDGTIVRAIDPVKYAAWSQGDVAHPNTKIPTIAAAVGSGVNMSEWVNESIECSGAGTEPFTDAQFEAVAHLVAASSRALGIPVNRSTVVVHADINSVSRPSDPWPPATPARRGSSASSPERTRSCGHRS